MQTKIRNCYHAWYILVGILFFASVYGLRNPDYSFALTCFSAVLAIFIGVLASTLWVAVRIGLLLFFGMSLGTPLLYFGSAVSKGHLGNFDSYLDGFKVSAFIGGLTLFPWIFILPVVFSVKFLIKRIRPS